MDIKENIIGINIKKRRGELCLTQRQLAAKMELDYTYIGRWERGMKPSAKYLAMLSKVLGISVEQLTSSNSKEEALNSLHEAYLRRFVEETLAYKEARKLIIGLEFPEKPKNLTKEESCLWNMNELALRRWEKTREVFIIPTWVLEKFCREAMGGPYEDGKRHKITGILKDFIKAGEK